MVAVATDAGASWVTTVVLGVDLVVVRAVTVGCVVIVASGWDVGIVTAGVEASCAVGVGA